MLDLLTSPRVLLALLFLGVASVLEPLLEWRLQRLLGANAALDWSWDHLLGPLLRAAIVAGFVLLAYPAIFGLREAPSIGVLLAGDALRVNRLVGLLFLLSLLLPLLTVFAKKSALLLPLQGLTATAMVFGWFVHDLGVTVASLWPGTPTALLLAVYVFAGHRLALTCSSLLGQTIDRHWHAQDGERLVLGACETLVQAPVMLLYGAALGQQVAI